MTKCLYGPVCKKESTCPRLMTFEEHDKILDRGEVPNVYELPPPCYELILKERN